MVQEFQALWVMLTASRISRSIRRQGVGCVLHSLHKKFWKCQPNYWHTWNFGQFGISAEISCWLIVAAGPLSEWQLWVVGTSGSASAEHCSLLLRLPFRAVSPVHMTFHGLIYISFKNRVRLWSWPNSNMAIAFAEHDFTCHSFQKLGHFLCLCYFQVGT